MLLSVIVGNMRSIRALLSTMLWWSNQSISNEATHIRSRGFLCMVSTTLSKALSLRALDTIQFPTVSGKDQTDMSTRVAVAGATGDMGLPVVEALLAAGFHVTGLTRQSSRNASKLPTHPRLVVAEVDYNSISSLKAALEDHRSVVSTLASTYVGEQNPLIDAAVAAGVKRFMPSEFGSNVLNPKRNKLPVFEGKVKTHEYLKTVATKNPGFTYILICNSAFLTGV